MKRIFIGALERRPQKLTDFFGQKVRNNNRLGRHFDIIKMAYALALGLIAFPSFAQNNNALLLTGNARTEAIKSANISINSLNKIEGRFVQINSNNTTNSGQFWLDRPGKMRFEYDAPSPILLVADGSSIAINDRKLKTVERYPLRSNPLYFLLKSGVNISQELNVTKVIRNNNKLIISLKDKKNEAQGELSLVFGPNNQLEEWSILDNRKRNTIIKLSQIKTSSAKDASFFKVKDIKRPSASGKSGH